MPSRSAQARSDPAAASSRIRPPSESSSRAVCQPRGRTSPASVIEARASSDPRVEARQRLERLDGLRRDQPAAVLGERQGPGRQEGERVGRDPASAGMRSLSQTAGDVPRTGTATPQDGPGPSDQPIIGPVATSARIAPTGPLRARFTTRTAPRPTSRAFSTATEAARASTSGARPFCPSSSATAGRSERIFPSDFGSIAPDLIASSQPGSDSKPNGRAPAASYQSRYDTNADARAGLKPSPLARSTPSRRRSSIR